MLQLLKLQKYSHTTSLLTFKRTWTTIAGYSCKQARKKPLIKCGADSVRRSTVNSPANHIFARFQSNVTKQELSKNKDNIWRILSLARPERWKIGGKRLL